MGHAVPTGPIEWRSSPWLAPQHAQSQDQLALHEAALDVLDEFNTRGTPFALYLRAFAVRQLYCHASDGGDGGDGILLDVHFARHLRQIGANIVRVQDTSMPDVLATETPGLLLHHGTWLAAVEQLIGAAQLIISECQFMSPGVVSELRACAEMRIDQTVLVTPSTPFEFVGNEDLSQLFPRMIQQFDLDLACPARTFVFEDLIERMAKIATLDIAERLQLIRYGRLDGTIPVTYRGVVEGQLDLARRYAQEQSAGATYFAGSHAIIAARAGLEEWQLPCQHR